MNQRKNKFLQNPTGPRAVITGLGCVSALGLNLADFWAHLEAGLCGIKELTLFDTSRYRTKIGAQAWGFEPLNYFNRRQLQRMARTDQIGMVAVKEALKDAGINPDKLDRQSAGVCMGGGAGGMLQTEMYRRKMFVQGPRHARPSLLVPFSPCTLTDYIAQSYNFQGPKTTIVTACSSSATAIGYALDWIRRGLAEIVVTGGSDAMCELTYSGFNSLRAVDEAPCRPFDLTRKGLSLGEAAGILIVESEEHALKRGARIYAELMGYGFSCDAYHMTAPDVDGGGAALAIAWALEDAGVKPEEVDYINAHGTSTKFNDIAETAAVKKVLGAHAKKTPISSTKSMVGHCLGAAGAVEAVATMLAVSKGIIPPTINYSQPDPQCDLDYVPNQARRKEVKIAVSNSLAFGGNNTSLVFGEYEE